MPMRLVALALLLPLLASGLAGCFEEVQRPDAGDPEDGEGGVNDTGNASAENGEREKWEEKRPSSD